MSQDGASSDPITKANVGNGMPPIALDTLGPAAASSCSAWPRLSSTCLRGLATVAASCHKGRGTFARCLNHRCWYRLRPTERGGVEEDLRCLFGDHVGAHGALDANAEC